MATIAYSLSLHYMHIYKQQLWTALNFQGFHDAYKIAAP